MLIQENLCIQEKLKILADAAKYDVACTSSGVKRKGKAGSIGNTSEAGICHSFGADAFGRITVTEEELQRIYPEIGLHVFAVADAGHC